MPLNYVGIGRAGRRGGGDDILNYLLQGQISSYMAGEERERRGKRIQAGLQKVYGKLDQDTLEGLADLALAGMPVSSQYLDQLMGREVISEALGSMDPEIAEAIKSLPFDMQGQAIFGVKKKEQELKEATEAKSKLLDYYKTLPKNMRGYPDIKAMTPEQIYELVYLVERSDPEIVSREQLDPLMNMFMHGDFQDPRESAKQTAKGAASGAKLNVLDNIWMSGRIDGDWMGLKPEEQMVVADLFNVESAEEWDKFRGNPVLDPKTRNAVYDMVMAKARRIASAAPEATFLQPEGVISMWKAGRLRNGESFDKAYPQISAGLGELLDRDSGDPLAPVMMSEAENYFDLASKISDMGDVAQADKLALQVIRIIQVKGYDNETDLRNWMKKAGLVDVQIDFIIENLELIHSGQVDNVLEKLKEL